MKAVMFISGFLLVLSSGFAEDLESAWSSFTVTGSEINHVHTRIESLLQEQSTLKIENIKLQEGATWYNGWLNKWLLSSNADRQLEIVRLIQSRESEKRDLELRRHAELETLKHYYALLASDYEKTGLIPIENRSTAQRVGRLINNVSPKNISLPDYGEMIKDQYKSPVLRRMVLEDLSSLLHAKLTQLDSMIDRQNDELELASRLADFHEDLGLQLAAGQDVQERDEQGESIQNYSWESHNDQMFDASVGTAASVRAASNETRVIRIDRQALSVSNQAEIGDDEKTMFEEKREEYQNLLGQIATELNQSQ